VDLPRESVEGKGWNWGPSPEFRRLFRARALFFLLGFWVEIRIVTKAVDRFSFQQECTEIK